MFSRPIDMEVILNPSESLSEPYRKGSLMINAIPNRIHNQIS